MNQKKINKYIDIARSTSNDINKGRNFKHVSMIFKGNDLLGIGTNNCKTHPLAERIGYRFNEMHAELDAYLKVRHYNHTDLILINFRFNISGDLKLAKPCKLCQSWCSIVFKDIWFSTNEKGFLCI